MARKKAGHTGGHGWFVTFADLMALLMSFFVMLVSFSSPNQSKMTIVSGSMREAFGNQRDIRLSGLIETDGIPTRTQAQHTSRLTPEFASDTTSPGREIVRESEGRGTYRASQGFAAAAASLRQAMQELPDIAELSRNIVIEETKEGLDLRIVDQEGQSMFPEGSAIAHPRTRAAILALAPVLRRMPNRLRITGHTSAEQSLGAADGWSLSTRRALHIRDLLAEAGLSDERFESVIGRADTQPIYPDAPRLAPNRRVTILLVREAPPLPVPLR
jgi:chemotaxis protein MotB